MQKKEPLLCAAQCLWTQDEFPLSQTRPVMENSILKVFLGWVDRSIGIGIGRKAFPSPWYHLWTSFGSFELIVLTAGQGMEAPSLGAGERKIHQFAIISMDNGYGNGKMTTLTGKKEYPIVQLLQFQNSRGKGKSHLPPTSQHMAWSRCPCKCSHLMMVNVVIIKQ